MAMTSVAKIVGLLVVVLAPSIGYVGASAQEIPGYTIFTSDRLGMSFEYPSSWSVDEKENRFESDLEVIVQGGPSAFTVLDKDDTIKEDVEILGFETVVNMLKDTLASQGTLIEDSDFERYSIDGRETGTFLILTQNDTPQQAFVVNDDGALVTLAYQDSKTNFDTPESQETMENIINSIKFTN